MERTGTNRIAFIEFILTQINFPSHPPTQVLSPPTPANKPSAGAESSINKPYHRDCSNLTELGMVSEWDAFLCGEGEQEDL